jgi:hypothetical protein
MVVPLGLVDFMVKPSVDLFPAINGFFSPGPAYGGIISGCSAVDSEKIKINAKEPANSD